MKRMVSCLSEGTGVVVGVGLGGGGAGVNGVGHVGAAVACAGVVNFGIGVRCEGIKEAQMKFPGHCVLFCVPKPYTCAQDRVCGCTPTC